MPEPVALRCPHCQAPLPVSESAVRVRCEYCGHVSQLKRTIAPQENVIAPVEIAYDVTRRIRVIVAVVSIAMVLGIGAVVAVVIVKSVKATSDHAERARKMQQQALEQADRMQREAFERVAEIQRGALDQAERAFEDVGVARTKSKAAAKRERQPATAKRESLPANPKVSAVLFQLRQLDLSHCPGPGHITYGVRVAPDGSTRTTSAGPVKAPGGALGCVRQAIEKLEFSRSRDGLELKFSFTTGN